MYAVPLILLTIVLACGITCCTATGQDWKSFSKFSPHKSDVKTNMTSNMSNGPVPLDCLKCICKVESDCKMPNPVCQMDVGSLSCGPYQIKKAYWQDAKLKGGDLMGDWHNCTATFPCSEDAVQGYMERYAIETRLRHPPTCEDFARIHNGGPNGYKNPNTVKYWDKVKACLGQAKNNVFIKN